MKLDVLLVDAVDTAARGAVIKIGAIVVCQAGRDARRAKWQERSSVSYGSAIPDGRTALGFRGKARGREIGHGLA